MRYQFIKEQQARFSLSALCRVMSVCRGGFYAWRKRLRKKEPVRFALVDRRAARQEPATDAGLELVLATGERLRIGTGVDGTTLRRVLEALRA